MSYFPAYKIWDLTPGQEVHVAADTQFGRLDSADAAKRCLGCHSTALPAKGQGIMPESRFFGVGCEACHGAGKAHIDAERAGHATDSKMAKPLEYGSFQAKRALRQMPPQRWRC